MSKRWTGESIRSLARKKLKESEESPAAKSLGNLGNRERKSSELLSGLSKRGGFDPLRYAGKEAANEFENDPSAWGAYTGNLEDRVITVIPAQCADDGEEIKMLCETLGLESPDTMFLKAKKPDPATYIGSGNLDILKLKTKAFSCGGIVIDAALSPSQVKNMEEQLALPVLDREAIILAIFQRHARTSLAKLQVEIAHLKYLQPRLSGLWMGLSRQSGGVGGRQGRGLGETRLELDRRTVKDRIYSLGKKLKEAEKAFKTQSSQRSRLPRVALVGYTNAGKSTLMNRLTKGKVEARDELFSTLDTTVRPLMPPTDPKILVSDTVGFVRDLPHGLVASFKSTLAEALESRLILHVVDRSHEMWEEQLETTEGVLGEIGAKDIPKFLILNKSDLYATNRISLRERRLVRDFGYAGFIHVSALQGTGLIELKKKIMELCGAAYPAWYVEEPAEAPETERAMKG